MLTVFEERQLLFHNPITVKVDGSAVGVTTTLEILPEAIRLPEGLNQL
jgi:hypothetical protein